MRRKRSSDVAESKNPTANAVVAGERGDERLARHLARRVKRDRQDRAVIFRRWHHLRLAVNRAAAGEEQLFRAGEAHRLEHVVRDEGAALEIEIGVFRTETDVAIGGEMPHEIRTNVAK